MARSFWNDVENTGDSIEFGLRSIVGIMAAVFLAGTAWAIGAYIWVGLSIALSIPAAVVGFIIGFFFVEIRLLFRVLIAMMT